MRLGEEPGVLDGDAGGRGKSDDELLVVFTELPGRLVAQVEVSVHLVANPDRHPQEARHRRVVGRETDRSWILGEPGQADGMWIVYQRTQEPVPLWQIADTFHLLRCHPDVDELFEPAVW